MRAALALSVLLLVLRSPLPSLSENNTTVHSSSTAASMTPTTKPVTSSASANQSSSSPVPMSTDVSAPKELSNLPATDHGNGLENELNKTNTVSPSSDLSGTGASTTGNSQNGTSSNPTTPAATTKPETTSNRNVDPATTHIVTTSGIPPTTSAFLKTIASTPSLASAENSTTHISHLAASAATVISRTSPQGQDSPLTASNNSSLIPVPSLSHITQTMLTTQIPVDVSIRTQQTSSMQPTSQVVGSPVPRSPAPPSPLYPSTGTAQRVDSTAGTVTTTSVKGPPGFSTVLASPGPSIPAELWSFGNKTVRCESLQEPMDKLLILNWTSERTNSEANLGGSHCNKSLLNEKLVTLLCQTAKDNFNPGQDNCTVLLGPVPDSHAVAVKHISIHTNLLPTDVYKSLKDQWDELKELGVSDMRLGDDHPSETLDDRYSMPLIITIVCMASFLLLVAALYGCCHQRFSQRKDQQRLTEELQTVENGYHDNPTLEVMETSSEMQEKKVVNLNGELGDSWIVPLDNLSKDDLDEEEDTHL
ncbi:podocalyxin isoform X2 [Octodon degus]|uniref:Podocalyxin n=1 Tax=Octodon degus TaxID=10160 RepID=A0A6P6E0U7_OCTDE|nr:podocalyxin isoform X2 [Octodon degus]